MGKFSDWIRNPGTGGPGTRQGIAALGFALVEDLPTLLGKYLRVDAAQSFTSPETQQGRDNLALGNVDNTSDEDKPVSTAQQAALDLKLNISDYSPPLQPVAVRLTAVSGVPVPTTNQTTVATIYATPFNGNLAPIYDGATFLMRQFAEISLALDGNAGHAGYHQSGKLFDVFIFDDAGTLRIGTGPAWTDNATRAAALAVLSGLKVNAASITLRFGSASGNTVVVATNEATYLGTFYATANGQTEDSLENRCIYNKFNRVLRSVRRVDTTASWAYSLAVWRQTRATAANRVAVVCGEDDASVNLTYASGYANTVSGTIGAVGIGVNSTSVNSAQVTVPDSDGANILATPTARLDGPLPNGYTQYNMLEYSQAAGAGTFFGVVATVGQTGMAGTVTI